MYKPKWYYLVSVIGLAFLLVGCGKDKPNTEVESANPSNDTSSASQINSSDAVSVPADIGDPSFDFGLGEIVINLEPQSVRAGEGTLLLNVTMPYGYKFNDQAPFQGDFVSDGSSVIVDEDWLHYEQTLPSMPLEIPMTFSEGQATVTADLRIYWCEAINETLCFVESHMVNIPIAVDPAADSSVANAVVALTPPE